MSRRKTWGAALLVYLWGIETSSPSPSSSSSCPLLVYLWGIETVFSPSPSPSSCPLLVYLWGIETVEYTNIYLGNKPVISLPMRNWNLSIVMPSISARTSLLVYLWGIETLIPVRDMSSSRLLLVYLWGIETVFSPSPSSCPAWVISLPMRNWNYLYIYIAKNEK